MTKKSKKTPTDADQPQAAVAADNPLNLASVATLKELRKATQHTQNGLAAAMGAGQGTISRIEKRDDMLLSTLQHYVEGLGGTLQIVVTFPHRPPLIVERLSKKKRHNV